MHRLLPCLVALTSSVGAACRATMPDDARPALRVDTTPTAQAELVAAIAASLGGNPVSIAPDALTRTSVLTLERRTPPGRDGRAATGRTLELPTRFTLMTAGSACYLVRDAAPGQADFERIALPRTRCVPE